jgi:hypothetical protein
MTNLKNALCGRKSVENMTPALPERTASVTNVLATYSGAKVVWEQNPGIFEISGWVRCA